MESMVEDDHGRTARVSPRDLDSVLHRLGPGVHQERPLDVITRRAPVELFTDSHVALIGSHHGACVSEASCLLRHGVADHRVGMADSDYSNGGAEVDQPVAVHVLDDRPRGAVSENRGGSPMPAGIAAAHQAYRLGCGAICRRADRQFRRVRVVLAITEVRVGRSSKVSV